MALFKNVEVLWANVLTPNTKFQPEWQVTALLDQDQFDILQEEAKKLYPKGLGKVKPNEDGFYEVKVKRRVAKADGTGDNAMPVCIDANRKQFDKNIGNGSICNVQYSVYYYDNKFGKGIGLDFKGIQVLEHVPYGIQDGEEFEDADLEEFDKPTAKKAATKTKAPEDFDDDDDFN
jgi:hypothetical protein